MEWDDDDWQLLEKFLDGTDHTTRYRLEGFTKPTKAEFEHEWVKINNPGTSGYLDMTRHNLAELQGMGMELTRMLLTHILDGSLAKWIVEDHKGLKLKYTDVSGG